MKDVIKLKLNDLISKIEGFPKVLSIILCKKKYTLMFLTLRKFVITRKKLF